MEILNSICAMIEYPAAVFLLFSGILLNIRTRFSLFRRFPAVFREAFRSEKKAISPDGLTSFQAFSYSLAGTLGIGNLVGTAEAIRFGGAGAVFWLWLSALLAAILKSAEIFLSRTHPGVGPLGYFRKAFSSEIPIKIYTVLILLAAVLMGNMAQSSAILSALPITSPLSLRIGAAIVTAITAVFLFLKENVRARAISVVMPVMTIGYLTFGMIVIAKNLSNIGAVWQAIFAQAFSFRGATGGIAGSLFLLGLRNGCMNGLFSHEAGMGSGAFAHAKTESPPMKEALFGVIEVFADSVLVSGITAFCLLTSGTETIPVAFYKNFGSIGTVFSCGAFALFGISSIVSWFYYAQQCLRKESSKKRFCLLFLTLCYIGGIVSTTRIWQAASMVNALALMLNLTAVLRRKQDFLDAWNTNPLFAARKKNK